MRRRSLVSLAAFAATACATSQAELDAAWERFECGRAATAARAEALSAGLAGLVGRQAVDEELVRTIACPPTSPVARLGWLTTWAGLAYLTEDLEALARATRALAVQQAEIDALERRLAGAVASAR